MKLATLPRSRPLVSLLAGALLGLSVAGCALPPKDPVARDAYFEANDPLEGVNRFVFGFNEATDILLVRPAAEIYRGVLPDPVRTAVQNFLRNLRSPIIIANQLLQGDWRGASVATRRFVVNTTVGIAGLVDVAGMHGLAFEDEDFGQTLAVWGIGEGPYMVLPLLGPSNLRDTTGLAADSAADPLRIVSSNNGAEEVYIGRTGASALDTRSRVIEPVDDLRRTSLDYYATVRSLYRQRRNADILDGQGGSEAIPDYNNNSSQ